MLNSVMDGAMVRLAAASGRPPRGCLMVATVGAAPRSIPTPHQRRVMTGNDLPLGNAVVGPSPPDQRRVHPSESPVRSRLPIVPLCTPNRVSPDTCWLRLSNAGRSNRSIRRSWCDRGPGHGRVTDDCACSSRFRKADPPLLSGLVLGCRIPRPGRSSPDAKRRGGMSTTARSERFGTRYRRWT